MIPWWVYLYLAFVVFMTYAFDCRIQKCHKYQVTPKGYFVYGCILAVIIVPAIIFNTLRGSYKPNPTVFTEHQLLNHEMQGLITPCENERCPRKP